MLHKYFILFLTCFAFCAKGAEFSSDVFVYGASPGGIAAAVAASREGKSVILVAPEKIPGGMMSGGLSASDIAVKEAIGGLAQQFFHDMGAVYNTEISHRFEPSAAEAHFENWIKKHNITFVRGQWVTSVRKQEAKIISVECSTGDSYTAEVFIDASYEGDLMAFSGVSYTYGRESTASYNEKHAGIKESSIEKQFPSGISAYDEHGRLYPEVQKAAFDTIGKGDTKIPAYNFRLCFTDKDKNLIPITKPDNYDPRRFILLSKALEKMPNAKLKDVIMFLPIGTIRKVDVNNNGCFSTNYIGGNWKYPEANQQERQKIWQAHKDYMKEFLYFISYDPSVPEHIRLQMQRVGYAKDEFVKTGHWPHQLYVRECRRMLGNHILTEHDVLISITKEDSVGLGSHRIESHPVQRGIRNDEINSVVTRGDVQVRVPMTPYEIPYRSISPRESECSNLLVTSCVSASHIAYSSLRMEPQYMIMGESAGVAASIAIDEKVPVQQVSIPALQKKLLALGQKIHF